MAGLKTELLLVSEIEAHGEKVKRLELRRPTVAEIRAVKALPYAIGQGDKVEIDTEAAAKYVATCAGIPPSSVNQLDPHDFNKACWVVAGFFLKSEAEAPAS